MTSLQEHRQVLPADKEGGGWQWPQVSQELMWTSLWARSNSWGMRTQDPQPSAHSRAQSSTACQHSSHFRILMVLGTLSSLPSAYPPASKQHRGIPELHLWVISHTIKVSLWLTGARSCDGAQCKARLWFNAQALKVTTQPLRRENTWKENNKKIKTDDNKYVAMKFISFPIYYA